MNSNPNRIKNLNISLLTVVLVAAVLAMPTQSDEIFAVQSRVSTPNFQLFLELNNDSSVNSSGPLFGPAGGVYGMTFLDDTAYAIELENGTFDDYLATIPHEGALVGQGSRVSTNAVGFPAVESLANVNGQLYATSLDFPGHETTLITIDETTGIGTAVGTGDRDVMIVGLAFDPASQMLYGAGMPFGDLVDDPNLYSLDVTTGATSLIGNMGQGIQSLAWHEDLGLIGAFDRLYQIDTTSGIATALGTQDFTDGMPGTFNGLYSLASPVSEASSLACDLNSDTSCSIVDLDLLYLESGLTTGQITSWLAAASAADPSGRTFVVGDTDLNGVVNFADFLSLSGNFGQASGATWGMGNFDNDGGVNFSDFLALSGNFGFDSTVAQSVPEPRCMWFCFGAWACVVMRGPGSSLKRRLERL